MPTILTCPSCGKRSQVDNKPPGSAVRCPHCSSVMKVPAEAARASAAAPATPQPAAILPAPLLTPMPAIPTISTPGYLCSVCGKSFPIEDVYDQDGAIICTGCHAAAAEEESLTPELSGSFPAVPTLSAVMAPAPAGVSPPSVANAPQEIEEEHDPIAELAAVSASAVSARRPPPVKKKFTISIPMLITGGSIAFLVICFLTYFLATHDFSKKGDSDVATSEPSLDSQPGSLADEHLSEWEQKNGPRLSSWRNSAKGLEVSGNIAGAQQLYQKMLLLSKSQGAAVHSPGLVAMLDEAQKSYDAISSKIGPLPEPVALAPPVAATGPTTSIASALPDKFSTPAVGTTIPSSTEPSTPEPTTPAVPAVVIDINSADWEPANHDRLLQLLADADGFEKHQQPIAALAKLQEIINVAGARRAPLTDAQIKGAVASAIESRKRLLSFARDSDDVRAITAHSFLAAGLKAEQDKKWKTAADLLSDASNLMGPMLKPVQRYRDPTYLASLNGTAVAYINLKQNLRASELFSEDEPLGRASLTTNAPTRELVWNRAVSDLAQKTTIMRSIKMLHDYMDAHSKESDEPLLNLLGTALFVGDESNPRDRKILDDAIGFYGQRSMDLEKTRPGERRWGIQWLPEADAKEKFDGYTKALDAYQEALRLKNAADSHVKDVEQALRARGNAIRATPADFNKAKAAVTQTTAALKTAKDAIPRPPWVTDPEPIIPKADTTAPITIGAAPTTAPSTAPAAPSVAGPASQPAVQITAPPAPVARNAAAFPIDRTHLVTAAEPLGSAMQVKLEDTLGNVATAKVVAKTDHLALLEVSSADSAGPLKFVNIASDFTGGPVQCAAISQANLFGPTVTLLTADAPVPSRSAWWVNLSDQPRLPGSPLLNAQYEVIGVEVASRGDPRQKTPSVTLEDLRKFLAANHVVPGTSTAKPDPNLIWQVSAEGE